MIRRSGSAIALALAITVVASGCSIVFVQPHDPVAPEVECTDGSVLPYVDATLAAGSLSVAGVLVYALATSPDRDPQDEFGTRIDRAALAGIVLFTGIAALYALSSASGFRRIRECRHVKHGQTAGVVSTAPCRRS